MPADYQVLATIHDEIHLGNFARHMTGRLLDFAQRNNWMGRQIVDLGCGSGESLRWLSQHGYIVTGIDSSPEMLNLAKMTLASQGMGVRLINKNIRQVDEVQDVDMILSLDTLSELSSLRDLEEVFRYVHKLLKTERLFVFDMYTIEGLFKRNDQSEKIEFENENLMILARNTFDYERQVQRRDYTIFRRDGQTWQRQDASRELRAYPIQGVTALLGRCGFEVTHVLDTELANFQTSANSSRVIIMALKK